MDKSEKRLPVGIDDFKKLIDEDCFYIDKTNFIEETFHDEVVLYTRPRRFGKSLNLSMLYYFYSIKEKANRYLFEGLKVSKSLKAQKYQNQYPVLFISFKDISGISMKKVLYRFSIEIQNVVWKFPELLNSDKLNEAEIIKLRSYYFGTENEDILADSLSFLTRCLNQHYGRRVILLIDEYDVPMQSAYEHGFYDEMIDFFRPMLSRALKSNEFLEKGILTGCLRVSKESIFTGLNNMEVSTILQQYDQPSFGFTQQEIDLLYTSFGYADKLPIVKKWYDGYQFGLIDIYNPWSTVRFLKDLISKKTETPESYWANSSGNSIISHYIEQADDAVWDEFQNLLLGKPIQKRIQTDLTYGEIEDPENIYSFLLMTGYLKSISKNEDGWHELMIPNEEVKKIYRDHFDKFFKNKIKQVRPQLMEALVRGEQEKVQSSLQNLLSQSVSYHDYREDFNHGMLLGLLSGSGFVVTSNREAGNGRFDLLVRSKAGQKDLVLIECKFASSEKNLSAAADKALAQIEDKGYIKDPDFTDYANKQVYGMAFYKKECLVKKQQFAE